MDENAIPRIETDRLLLRAVAMEDLEEWARLTFADPDVVRYMPKRDLTPLERAQRARKVFAESWDTHGFGGWLVTNKTNGQILGECNFDREEMGEGDIELGYSFAKAYWGKGYATEAARAAVRWGFEYAGMDRIVAVVVPENVGSWKVLEHLGFVFEKDAQFYDFDVAYYSLTPEQFDSTNAYFQMF